MSNKLHKETETDEEKILKQGFKIGATTAFMAAGYPVDDITDKLLDVMYREVMTMYANKKIRSNFHFYNGTIN